MSGFELYAVFSPLVTKHVVISSVNKLLKWIKKEEDRLFILSSPNFSWRWPLGSSSGTKPCVAPPCNNNQCLLCDVKWSISVCIQKVFITKETVYSELSHILMKVTLGSSSGTKSCVAPPCDNKQCFLFDVKWSISVCIQNIFITEETVYSELSNPLIKVTPR